jgi:hypothetical protein
MYVESKTRTSATTVLLEFPRKLCYFSTPIGPKIDNDKKDV